MTFYAYTPRLGHSWWFVSPFGSHIGFLEGESASPSPFQLSLRSLPPLRGRRAATKGDDALGSLRRLN